MKGDSIRFLTILVLLAAGGVAHADSGRPAKATGPLRVHPTNPRYFTDGEQHFKVSFAGDAVLYLHTQEPGPERR